MIGKGGSSRVFRVLNHANELYAIKRVSLDKTDAETMSGYMNEIALLKRLDGNSRIIRLIDSEVKPGPGGSKGHLLLVMECGEIDLARLLQEQMKEPVNMVWVAYYWQQVCRSFSWACLLYFVDFFFVHVRCSKRCMLFMRRRSCIRI
jgi:serine/threonine-protein kinase TTK/MPS1